MSLCGLCAVLAGFYCRRRSRRRVGLSAWISFPFRIICCFLAIYNPATCLEGCLHFLFSTLFCSVLLSFPAKSVTLCETLLLWIFIFSLLQPKVEVVSKQQTSFNKVYTKRQIEKLQKGKKEVIEKWHFRRNWYPKEGDLSEINTSTSINCHFCVLNHCFFHRKHYYSMCVQPIFLTCLQHWVTRQLPP